jgi:thiamine-phosphate pyrophosphorylase
VKFAWYYYFYWQMQLIIITPDATSGEETKIINSLFEHGLQRLHLRKPSFVIQDYRDYLMEIDRQYHSCISIHRCFELYHEFRLGGIHLNSMARNDAQAWQQVKDIPPSAVSTSFHAWEEVEENTFPYGYVFISPVFDSISKNGYKAGIDLAKAKEIKQSLATQNRHCPSIIGLGGVGVQQLATLYQCGFDGAAMLGAIWQSENPLLVFTEAMGMIHSLQGD